MHRPAAEGCETGRKDHRSVHFVGVPGDALSQAFHAAVQHWQDQPVGQGGVIAFAEELADLPGAKRLLDAHERYVIAVTRSLLERAAAEGEIEEVDTAAVAYVLRNYDGARGGQVIRLLHTF